MVKITLNFLYLNSSRDQTTIQSNFRRKDYPKKNPPGLRYLDSTQLSNQVQSRGSIAEVEGTISPLRTLRKRLLKLYVSGLMVLNNLDLPIIFTLQ
jgi:hypothetical protein